MVVEKGLALRAKFEELEGIWGRLGLDFWVLRIFFERALARVTIFLAHSC